MDFILFKALSNPTHHHLLQLQTNPPPASVVEITSGVTHKDYNAWI